MTIFTPRHTRRNFFRLLSASAASAIALRAFPEEAERFIADGDYAQALIETPPQTEGPFFPDKLPLDTDNDLVLINSSITPAAGVVTHLSGRILDTKGDPIRNSIVEIWQVDNGGAYLHSESMNKNKSDKHFQGYGRFLTGSKGEYYFRTIKPVPYPGRTPHIHVKVSKNNKELLVTQCCIKGESLNSRDGVLNGIRDSKQRESVIVAFDPVKNSKAGELAAIFDIIIGHTPADATH